MEILSASVALYGGIHQSQVDPPHKEPIILSFDVFFVVGRNKLLPVIWGIRMLMWRHYYGCRCLPGQIDLMTRECVILSHERQEHG